MNRTDKRLVAHTALATAIIYLVLIQPNHPAALGWRALFVFPLELPVVVLAMVAFGDGRVGRFVRAMITAALTLLVVLKTADFIMFTALNRGFNPVADISLVWSLVQLIDGAFGVVAGYLAVLGALLAIMLVALLLWWSLGLWARFDIPFGRRLASVTGAGLFAVFCAAEIGDAMGRWSLPIDPPGSAFTARVGVERVEMTRKTLADLQAFQQAAANDPYAGNDSLLRLIDRDTLIIFVESYGRTSFDTPQYADLHLATLREGEATLRAAGLSMATRFLSSPTRGGQSWLAHATFANGLWVDGQTSYGAVLASGRQSLFHIAARSGFHTATVMPQITLDWPEAEFMGFETVLVAEDLGYAGEAFNWVTMPDQFTLAALDRLLRSPGDDDRPLFAQAALVSSHAPWVPVPDLLDWETIGDGTIYNETVQSGDAPRDVWRDRDRVRAQYRLAVDYALQTVLAYAELHASEPPLMIVIGDHQATNFVALDERPDVPIHVIGPSHLVEPLQAAGFEQGLIPAEDSPVVPMDQMRNVIIDVYSAEQLVGHARQ
ncbi:MAG: sulfatase-like hydrolase/transferase [Pseudomonadota bacterium]